MTIEVGADEQQSIYESSADGTARFVLGTVGENPLICFGVNPSIAVPGAPDHTIRCLSRFAADNGYDSWTMLNLYPQISTDPRGMDRTFRQELKAENEEHIARVIEGHPTLLAAWGGTIRTRKYLPALLRDILELTAAAGSRWLSINEPLSSGHPRHPSRAKTTAQLQPFDMAGCLRRIG